MPENPEQPREFDAVLGGEVPSPIDGAVLGGIEGVKRRLASSDIEQRITALKDAIKYGNIGIDIIISLLKDSQEAIQKLAYDLLIDKAEDSKALKALWAYKPIHVLTL